MLTKVGAHYHAGIINADNGELNHRGHFLKVGLRFQAKWQKAREQLWFKVHSLCGQNIILSE